MKNDIKLKGWLQGFMGWPFYLGAIVLLMTAAAYGFSVQAGLICTGLAVVYLVIAVSQLRMRKILQAQGGEIRLRMWLYPYLTWLVIAFITFVLVVMLFRPAQQLEVISTGLLALGIICTVPIMSRWKKLVLWQKLPLQNTR